MTRADDALARIAAVLDGVFASLEESRRAMLDRHAAASGAGRRLRREDVAELRDLLHRHLAEHDRLIAGTGVILAPDVLEGTLRWLEWYWRASPRSEPRFLVVELDPTRADYYDYERAAWFDVPRRTRARAIVGPHVDHGATDQHLVTPTVPILAPDFLGVVAADVRVSELEPIVLRELRAIGQDAALVNADGRVIAATTPRFLAGSLIGDLQNAVRRPDLPWTLVLR